MAPRPLRTRAVSRHEVRQYLGKSEEFLAVAEDALASTRHVAATGNAVHAAINAADVVCGAQLGRRATAPDHAQVLELLAEAGPPGEDVRRHLRRVLPLKVKAEYEPDEVPRRTAEKAVDLARRMVVVARDVVERAER